MLWDLGSWFLGRCGVLQAGSFRQRHFFIHPDVAAASHNPSLPVALGVLGLRFSSTRDVLLRQPYLRPRRGGDLGFVSRGTSQQNIPLQMFLQLQTLRRHVSRPVAAGVSLSLEDRRWDCLVLLKDGHTSVRESLFLLAIVAGLVLSAPAALLPLIVRRTSGHLLRSTRSSWDLKG